MLACVGPPSGCRDVCDLGVGRCGPVGEGRGDGEIDLQCALFDRAIRDPRQGGWLAGWPAGCRAYLSAARGPGRAGLGRGG